VRSRGLGGSAAGGRAGLPDLPLIDGQTLSSCEILGPLGAGAMGEVYRARDTRLEPKVTH